MRKRNLFSLLGLGFTGLLSSATPAVAGSVHVVGGETSVALDFAALSSAASLNLSGVSSDVIAPGALGAGSVAFGINPRTDPDPTTFNFNPNNFLGTFGGTIEHTGSVFFNDDAVEVGGFRIGFDGDRAGSLDGNASGFFVESTTGISAILFDLAAPSALEATATSLQVDGDLLVSSEFAGFLQTNGLSTGNLSGVDIGDASIQAVAAPTPSAAAAGLLLITAIAGRRRLKPTAEVTD